MFNAPDVYEVSQQQGARSGVHIRVPSQHVIYVDTFSIRADMHYWLALLDVAVAGILLRVEPLPSAKLTWTLIKPS